MSFRTSPPTARKKVVAFLATALLISACGTEPSVTGPSMRSTLADLGSASTWNGADGSVEVCKYTPDAAGAAAWAEFEVSATGNGVLSEGPRFVLEGGSTVLGSCVTVWRPSESGTDWSATVTVTEVDMSPGMTLSLISVNQPNLDPDSPFANTRADYTGVNTVTVTVREGFGARYIFKNLGVPDEPPPGGLAGCTPGFWRQAHHYQYWTTFTPTQTWSSVFTDPGSHTAGGRNGATFNGSTSLGAAVQLGGGGIFALARHGVAALLNAASPNVDYGMTPAQVIALVNSAIASGDYDTTKNQLEALNERGCTAKD